MEVMNDTLVIRRPQKTVREGWATASRKLAETADDALVMGEFANADDAKSTWQYVVRFG